MTLNNLSDVLTARFSDLSAEVLSVIPNLIVAIVLVILGWLVGAALSKVVSQIFKVIKLDKLLSAAGLSDLLDRASIRLDSGKFVGEIIKWFTVVVFMVSALEVLGLSQVNIFLQEVVISYIPNVLAAVLIMLVAVVIADALRKVVVASAKAADIVSANFLGSLTKWSIWIFATLAALFQLGIGAMFIQTLFTGIVVAAALAFGLSFGLGGRDAAATFIEKVKKEISSHKN